MKNMLDSIAAQKRLEVIQAKQNMPLSRLKEIPLSPIRYFIKALTQHNPAVIAEIKKASPSKGLLCETFDVARIAESYEKAGASCLSVLTDRHFFQGDPSYIALAKAHCNLPVLRKDFIIDAYQIEESRALGADCILLIVAMLDDHELLDFCQLAQSLSMAVLVESHTRDELDRALRLPTPLMGVNNRSLQTFHTDINTSINLAKQIPSDKIIISESGIHSREDIKLLQSHGISTFLIGESLMRAEDPGKQLERLIGSTLIQN